MHDLICDKKIIIPRMYLTSIMFERYEFINLGTLVLPPFAILQELMIMRSNSIVSILPKVGSRS